MRRRLLGYRGAVMYRLGMILGLTLVTAGCDSPASTCARAQARLAQCDEQARAEYSEAQLSTPRYVDLPSALSSCESVPSQCIASCVVDSPCSVINYDMFQAGHTDPSAVRPPGGGQFLGCMQYCEGFQSAMR